MNSCKMNKQINTFYVCTMNNKHILAFQVDNTIFFPFCVAGHNQSLLYSKIPVSGLFCLVPCNKKKQCKKEQNFDENLQKEEFTELLSQVECQLSMLLFISTITKNRLNDNCSTIGLLGSNIWGL